MEEHMWRAEARPEGGRPEEREVVGLDPLLQLVALLLRQPAGGYRGVDPVLERLLERGAELARLDTQALGGIVDDRLALLARRVGRELCRGDSGACAADRQRGRG